MQIALQETFRKHYMKSSSANYVAILGQNESHYKRQGFSANDKDYS